MATVTNQFICVGDKIDLERFIEQWQINKAENLELIVMDSHFFDENGQLRLTIQHKFYNFFEVFINSLTKYASSLKISFNCWTFDSDEINGNAFIMTYRHRNNELKYYPMLSSVRKNLSISKEGYIYLPENKELKDFSELIKYALTRFFGEALFEFNLNEVDTGKTVVLSCERLDSGYYLMKLSNDKCLLIDFVDFQYKRMTFSLEEAYESLQNLYEQPWRLPSTIELRWMDSHLKMRNQGNFTRSPYWSSEFKGHDGGLTYIFGFGVEPDPRDMRYKVRLVLDLDEKMKSNLAGNLKKRKENNVKRVSKVEIINNGNFVIEKNSKGQKLEVAEHDFPNKINWFEAAEACEKLGDGWRLPTRNELKQMFIQLHQKGFGNFKDEYYLSSSVTPSDNASFYYFGGEGYTGSNYKNFHEYVRAVRDVKKK
jgi:hypothetical protein